MSCSKGFAYQNSKRLAGCCAPGGGGGVGPAGPAGPPGPTGPTGGGGGGGGTLSVGITGPGATGPFAVEELLFDGNDGFTYTALQGVSGGIIGNTKIIQLEGWMIDKPPSVSGHAYTATSSTQVDLSWIQFTPEQVKSAYVVALDSYPRKFDYFPFINDFMFGYKEQGASYIDVSALDITGGLSSWQNYVNTAGNFPNSLSNVRVTATGSASTPSITTGSDRLNIFLGSAAVGKSYQFRFAYNNDADGSLNYVYWPDASGHVPFGNYGPANAPLSLAFSNASYNTLSIGGQGSNSGMDASLNTAYGTAGLDVTYGVDTEGTKRTGALQVGGTTAPTNNNVSDGPINIQAWGPVSLNASAFPEYDYTSVNTPSQTYYAVNTSADFSNVNVFANNAVVATDKLPIPTTTQAIATVSYRDFLPNGTMTVSITGGTNQGTAWQRTPPADANYIQHSNVRFLDGTDTLSVTDNTSSYNVKCNFGDSNGNTTTYVDAGSLLGLDSSGVNLTRFTLDVSGISSNVPLITSPYKVGWITGSDEDISNTYLRFTSSQMIDTGAPSGIKTEGYYLGTTLAAIGASDLSLAVVPDICNNGVDGSGKYLPYTFSFEQIVDSSTTVNALTRTRSAEFSTAAKPTQDTSLINFSGVVEQTPSLQSSYFYGIQLPGDLSFNSSFDIANINPTWAPSNTGSVFETRLFLDPTGVDHEADYKFEQWRTTNQDTTHPVNKKLMLEYTNNTSGAGTSDYNRKQYSRDMSVGNQFRIEAFAKNNLLRTPSQLPTVSSQNDLSFAGLPLWWDFTWTQGANVPLTTSCPHITVPNTVTFSLTETQNPYDCSTGTPLPSAHANHDFTISYDEAMWANTAWYGDNSGTTFSSDVYPYIDYSTDFYGQTRNYASFDNSGTTQTVSMNSNLFFSGSGNYNGPYSFSNIKWIGIRLDTPASIGLMRVEIDSAAPTSGLYNNYVMFYREQRHPATPASNTYTWVDSTNATNTLAVRDNSPWLDVGNDNGNSAVANSLRDYNTAQAAGTVGELNGIWDDSKTTYNITALHGGIRLYRFLLIGILKGESIGDINVSFGTT